MHNPWLILIAGVVGALATMPGQTPGVSPFIDLLIETLQLSRANLSLAYLIGTVTSALTMPFAGGLYDRYGSRATSLGAGFALGLSLLAISFVDVIITSLATILPMLSRAIVATAVMACGFYMIRFFGQGFLSMSSRNMVMKWFDSRRGIATAILAPCTALGSAYAPRVFDTMIATWGWRGAWRITALILMTLFCLFAWIVFADPSREERHAVRDSAPFRLPLPKTVRRALSRRAEVEPARPESDFTIDQAKKTLVFWLFNMTNGFSSLVSTGFTFHVVSIFAYGGMTRSTALAVFFPATMIAMVLQFVGSMVSDYVRLKYFAALQMLGVIILMMSLMILRPGIPYALLVVGLALNSSMSQISAIITWPRFFGLKHLGRISGFAFVWLVAGSAIGPYAYSLSEQFAGHYRPAAIGFASIAAALFVLSFFAENPNRTRSSSAGSAPPRSSI